MNIIERVHLPEHLVEDKRLGRHVEHDPQSKDYPFELAEILPLHNVKHKRHGSIFNQGGLGSCTGNAAAGAINTEPLYHVDAKKTLTEADAVSIYELATILDGFPGQYPPDDTGSSGLAAAKACRNKGYIKSFQHTFSSTNAVQALQKTSVITGVNWYEGFDTPDAKGLVQIAGQVRGGHEFEVVEYKLMGGDPLDDVVGADNSWGTSYGVSGRFFFTVRTWAQLLSEQGDVTVLLP